MELGKIGKMVLYAFVGEDDFGATDYPGLKQAITSVGIVPLVVVEQHLDRFESNRISEQMEAQARAHGKKAYLVRFVADGIVSRTEAGE